MALIMCFDKIMASASLTLRLYIFGICSVLTCRAKCGLREYLSPDGDCCPMCNKGSVVSKDCSGDYRTSCKPCSEGTFMNLPNGLDMCLQCKACGRGFSILRDCTKIQDTVCEVSDGYYCLDYRDGGCIRAVEHRKCTPGQHIKTLGTKKSNTMCESCPPGFYSPEGVNCTKWTDCSANNEVVNQEGTSITDVKCTLTTRRRYGLIGVPAVVILSAILLGLYKQIKCKNELPSPVEETSPKDQTDAAQSRSKTGRKR